MAGTPEQEARIQRLLAAADRMDEMRKAEREAASRFREVAIEWDAGQERKRRAMHISPAKFKEEAIKWEAERRAAHATIGADPPAGFDTESKADNSTHGSTQGRRPLSFREVERPDGTWEWEVIPDYSRGRMRLG